MRKLLRNCVLFDPEASAPRPGSLLIEDGRIRQALPAGAPDAAGAEISDLQGRILAPGFIDLHFHGAAIFHDADSSGSALRHDASSCESRGYRPGNPPLVMSIQTSR